MKGLALDGGGVFGIGQANILSKVDASRFEFFAGTSIGAAIAATLASHNTANLPDFFYSRMPKIFNGNWWKRYRFWGARYDDKELNIALQELLPGRFGASKKPLFITAANLATQKLKVFYSGDPDDSQWPLWEVVRASVAAETYFPPWKGYGDGGLFANNPSMVAITGVCKKLNISIPDIELCSIGTGSGTVPVEAVPTKNWSSIHWGLWAIRALLNGAANSMHEYFTQCMPLKKYIRIQFSRDKDWAMDNPADMLVAERVWLSDISSGIQEVKEFLV
jgi:predicted acylesterase/phospholipase RssA